MIFNTKHPYLCFALGIIIAGHKFPWDWWVQPASDHRKAAMQATSFGILPADDNSPEDAFMREAWDRILAPGRTSHDLTNLVIEWTRRWTPYATKFLCSLFCYGLDLWVIETIWRLI